MSLYVECAITESCKWNMLLFEFFAGQTCPNSKAMTGSGEFQKLFL